MLRLYRGDKCVSVLKMMLFHTTPRRFDVTIESDTVVQQRRKKYNTLLRMIGLILCTNMRWGPWKASTISSVAVSWISVYLLHRMGFKIRHIISDKGVVPKSILKMYKAELSDKQFLASKIPQGKTAKESTQWKVVRMELRLKNRQRLRRNARSMIKHEILPTVQCL